MQYTPPGRIKTVEDFAAAQAEIDPSFRCDQAVTAGGPLATETRFGARLVPNRMAIHPMEGWDGTDEGGPTEHTLRRWRHFGRSGAGLVWGGEAYAVHPDGRANPNQLHLAPGRDNAAVLATLLAQVHDAAEGCTPIVGLQLTHSGRFSRPHGDRMVPLVPQPNAVLERKYASSAPPTQLTDEDLADIRTRYLEAAGLAAAVGFDFVDVKCCHGYLLHEMLGARDRRGAYGGSFENRTRLVREIIEAIRTVHPELDVGVRVSISDIAPHEPDPTSRIGRPMIDDYTGFGTDWSEAEAFLAMLVELGVEAVNVTLGSPYYCPHAQRPATYPPSDGYLPPEDPLLSVFRHLEVTRRCKAAQPSLLVVGSGYSYLQEWLGHVAQYEVDQGHVDCVGLGRMALSYPHFPADLMAGRPIDRTRLCRTFSDCTTAPRNGMISGCFPLDPHYKQMPEAQQVRVLTKKARTGGDV